MRNEISLKVLGFQGHGKKKWEMRNEKWDFPKSLGHPRTCKWETRNEKWEMRLPQSFGNQGTWKWERLLGQSRFSFLISHSSFHVSDKTLGEISFLISRFHVSDKTLGEISFLISRFHVSDKTLGGISFLISHLSFTGRWWFYARPVIQTQAS